MIVLVSFSVFGNDSYVPFFISFISSCIEFVFLHKNSGVFTQSELSIYKKRLRKLWILFLFPVVLKAFKKNKAYCAHINEELLKQQEQAQQGAQQGQQVAVV